MDEQLVIRVASAPIGNVRSSELPRLVCWIDPRQRLTVGRDDSACDLSVGVDRRLSACHFELLFKDGGFRVRDLSSRHGTLLNGEPIVEVELHDGDIIRAGESTFSIELRGLAAVESVADQQPSEPAEIAETESQPDPWRAPFEAILNIEEGPFGDLEFSNLSRLLNWLSPGQRLTVGRGLQADMRVYQDQRMSAVHFEFICEEDGCRIRDLDSRNGTYLNGRRIREAAVSHGDRVKAGSTVLGVGILRGGEPFVPASEAAESTDSIAQLEPDRVQEERRESAAAERPAPSPRGMPLAPMRVVIVIQSGPFGDATGLKASRLLVWFGAGEAIVVGRVASRANLTIGQDPGISAAHFEVSCDGRRCRLRDLDSSNGTFVNDKRVSQAILRDGDQIRAGHTILGVTIEGGEPISKTTAEFSMVPVPEPAAESSAAAASAAIELPGPESLLAKTATMPDRPDLDGKSPEAIQAEVQPDVEQVRAKIAAGQPLTCAALNELDLADADLQNAKLLYCVLDGVNLAGANLTGAELTGSTLHQCNLSGANLSKTRLGGTIWSGCVADGVVLAEANLDDAAMGGAKLPVQNPDEVEISLDEADVPSHAKAQLFELGVVGFRHVRCQLAAADFTGCRAANALLHGVDLTEADFSKAVFDESIFMDCDLSGANFKRATLQACEVREGSLENVDLSRSQLQGVQFHNVALVSSLALPKKLGKCGFTECDLRGRDLTECDLSKADFSRSRLDRARFQGSSLAGATFAECDLREFDFRDLDLRGADFRQARLDGAVFSHADLTDAQFDQASLVNAVLQGVTLRSVSLVKVDLSGAVLVDAVVNRAQMMEVQLRQADLRGATFELSILDKVDFCATILQDTTFQSCLLKGTKFNEMDLSGCVLACSNFSGADLQNANLAGADCRQATFAGANLSGSSLRGVNGEACKFMGAILRGVDLSGTRLGYANFDEAVADRADFSEAVLEAARFVAASCKSARFVEAVMPHADLSHADLTQADFTQADLSHANLHRVIERGTIWRRSNRAGARETDEQRAAAEDWRPPEPEEQIVFTPRTKGSA